MNEVGSDGLQRCRAFLFGVVAASASALLACGGNSASSGSGSNTGGAGVTGGGAGGSETASLGGAGSGGVEAQGGSPNGGVANTAPGSGGSAGSPGGAVGAIFTESELAPSYHVCKPDCPSNQYCVLIGRNCTTEPCLVHAVCRDLPLCGESLACPLGPAQQCFDDPVDSCKPAAGMACPGRCNCAFNGQGCLVPMVADWRPDRCECVTPGPTTDCLRIECPDDTECVIALGKAYCVLP